MKLNEKSIKNDSNINNKFDFSSNFTMTSNKNDENQNEKFFSNYDSDNNNNNINVDPRLELTLKYLDIMHTLGIFINNYISFNDLLLLSKKDLIELGFSLVERNRIFNFAQEYKNFGVKYNISEINEFFNKYENLNISLVTNNKYNNRIKSNINDNINYIFNNNNKNINTSQNNYNDLFFKNNNYSNKNIDKDEEPSKAIISIKKQHNFPINLNNNEDNENFTSYENKAKIPTKNKSKKNLNNNHSNLESNYHDSINTNKNYNNNNHLGNSSKLIRQNSKISKNSSYSKSSKSRIVTVSKFFGGDSGSIIQKYQNISEEIDNYFRKYNDYREQKKNRMKVYEILGTSNKRKNTKPIYKNKMKENKIDEKEINENVNKNREDEIKRRLLELQQRKKMLQERLNDICEKDNKRLIIIKYLEEEEK